MTSVYISCMLFSPTSHLQRLHQKGQQLLGVRKLCLLLTALSGVQLLRRLVPDLLVGGCPFLLPPLPDEQVLVIALAGVLRLDLVRDPRPADLPLLLGGLDANQFEHQVLFLLGPSRILPLHD